jgi:hypothetical protein
MATVLIWLCALFEVRGWNYVRFGVTEVNNEEGEENCVNVNFIKYYEHRC